MTDQKTDGPTDGMFQMLKKKQTLNSTTIRFFVSFQAFASPGRAALCEERRNKRREKRSAGLIDGILSSAAEISHFRGRVVEGQTAAQAVAAHLHQRSGRKAQW